MNETIMAFGYPDTVIKEYDHWIVLLRPQQITIGTLVLAAKGEARHLGELNSDVWAEFDTVSRDVETLLRDTFSAEKFNYLALMMKDPNVHFHFIPRYSRAVTVNSKEFVDPDWPLKTELKPIEITEDEFEEIKMRLTQ
jgi:diadenosine tetraphosphate (Ap4A) HIT family hydrolase